MRRHIRSVGMVAAVTTALGLCLTGPASAAEDTPFISELHYDNTGAASGEGVGAEGPGGVDLPGWQVVLYNGNGGTAYATSTLSGTVPAAGVVVQTYPANGVQNGSPDGVALARPYGTLVE